MADLKIDTQNNALIISYNYQSEEHKQFIDQFKARIKAILTSQLKPEYNDVEKALLLYRYISQSITYVDSSDVSPYNALMNGEGICQSYAGAYEFLLNQVGISCLSSGAFLTDKNAHAWTVVKLGKNYYHMDPTFENSSTKGNGLVYFGMNDDRRMQSGAVKPFSSGCDDWFKRKAPACANQALEALQYVANWELVPGKHEALLHDSTGNAYLLNTETLEITQK